MEPKDRKQRLAQEDPRAPEGRCRSRRCICDDAGPLSLESMEKNPASEGKMSRRAAIAQECENDRGPGGQSNQRRDWQNDIQGAPRIEAGRFSSTRPALYVHQRPVLRPGQAQVLR